MTNSARFSRELISRPPRRLSPPDDISRMTLSEKRGWELLPRLALVQKGSARTLDVAGPSFEIASNPRASEQSMTGDMLRTTGGAVQRRNRANSLADPALCDLYRRSFSEAPEGTQRPRQTAVTRSHSVKVRKTRSPPEVDAALPRWYCYRIRSFHLSSRGVVNRGDSLRYRQARSVPRVVIPPSDNNNQESRQNGDRHSRDNDTEKFCLQLLGVTGVGKTALGNQFLTSEHIFVRSNLPEISCGEPSVTVLLNGQESQLTFIDGSKQGDEDSGVTPDGFLVVYSVASVDSFEQARKTLQELKACSSNKAIILVGNKSDLVRARCVTPQEGRNLASSFNVKFIETSVGINHNVDELLVGALAQIRLKQKGRGKMMWPTLQKASFRVRRMIRRIMGKDEPPPPCDMLHAL